MSARPTISVLYPARAGGELLQRSIAAVRAQRIDAEVEIVVVDSGSGPEELDRLRAAGARVVEIDPGDFDHGRTRDLAASLATGQLLVFLNQDAVPAGSDWLARLTAPLAGTEPAAAAQGGIAEFPAPALSDGGRRRFYWDSCGPRFYFTSESRSWIARYGLGFSTVNCALRRAAWERLPFGAAAILEDKRWQQGAHARGLRIVEVPDALVWHSHDYALGGLLRRCLSEGYGWRLVGERYRLGAALRDAGRREVWRDWRHGLRTGELRRPAELLFPLARPLALWWGNRWARRVRH